MVRATAPPRRISAPLRIGGSLGAKSAKHESSKMLNLQKLSHFLELPQDHVPQDDIPQHTSSPTLLYNTRCKFVDTISGCMYGSQCRFLHDETPDKCVFHTGNETFRLRSMVCEPVPAQSASTREVADADIKEIEHGPMCNARIYIGNIPPLCPEEFLENIGNTVGKVTGVTFLNSKLCSGRHAGFMNMTSEAQALAAVARLGATVFDGTPLYAKLQSAFPLQRVKSRGAERPCFAVKPRDANKPAATIDGDGFVTRGSKHRAASVIDRPKLRTITSWASLFIDDVSVAETAAAEQVEAAAARQVEAKQVEAKQVEAAVGQVKAKRVEAKQVEAAAAGQVEAVAVAEAVHHDDTEMEAMRQHRVGLHTVTEEEGTGEQRNEGLPTQILNKHIDELILDLIKEVVDQEKRQQMPSLKPVARALARLGARRVERSVTLFPYARGFGGRPRL